MNDILEPPVPAQRTDGSQGDLDGLLQRYYRAEMPNPWPAPPVPAEAPRSTVAPTIPSTPRRFRWHSPHLAMAAAVALFLIGYAVLYSSFPDNSSPTLERTPGQRLGKKDERPKTPILRFDQLEKIPLKPSRRETVPMDNNRKAEINIYPGQGDRQVLQVIEKR